LSNIYMNLIFLKDKIMKKVSTLVATVFLLGSAGAYSQDKGFPLTASLWTNWQIPVCWENENSAPANQRSWVQNAVAQAWEANSDVRFVGWGQCQASSQGIRIGIQDAGPHTKGLGRNLNGVVNGMVLNFTYNNWSPSCQSSVQYCSEVIAVHEFGHALGFAHEQNRGDTPRPVCTNDPQGTNGDVFFGAWDLASVMNYCNPSWNGSGNLSATDIRMVRNYYSAAGANFAYFNPVYAVGDNGAAAPNGIGGYDLLSSSDKVFSFDYNGDNLDDLFTYRPGRGAAFVIKSEGNGSFTPVYAVGDNGAAAPNGIGGYDLLSYGDRAFPFDYNGDGKDDIFTYRPGSGAAFVIKSEGDGNFSTVYAVGDNGAAAPNGIAGYDLLSSADQVLPFDYNGDGRDDLLLYRPGRGAAFVARSNGDGSFTPVYAVGDNGSAAPNGIGGYDLLSGADKVLVFDYNGDGRDDLLLYRPGRGAAFVVRSNGDGSFTPVYAVGDNGSAAPNGIGGYDLLSGADQVFAFDYNGDGLDDLALYRPGRGAIFVARSEGNGNFTPVYAVGDDGSAGQNGIGGFDLLSANDKAMPFDFNGDGLDDLFLYRTGQGAAFAVRSNGNGSFSTVYGVLGTTAGGVKGIGGYDLLSFADRVLTFDFDGDGKDDLLPHRPGHGAVFVVRSNGD
jgi:FG-GAP-like repeat